MPFLTVVGHSNLDILLSVARIPKHGESTPVSDRRTVWGGTACNIARQAAGLGVPVRLWSRVGPDFPDDWRSGLVHDGVELAFDTVDGGRTPACTIFTDPDGRQVYAMDQGAMAPPYEVSPNILDDTTWLHIATGDPDSYLPLARAAHAEGVHIGFDPGQEIHFAYDAGTLERMLDLADVFWCNEGELRKAMDLMEYGDPVQLLDHADSMIVTHGAGGAAYYPAKGQPVGQRAFPTDVVEPTGAGDAVRAGWYAGTADGLEPLAALRTGQATAAVIMRHHGPQAHVVQRSEVDAVLAM